MAPITEEDELLLTNADFPDYFTSMAHPDDYILSEERVFETIYHTKPHHNRLLLRASWKIEQNGNTHYLPMTFVCDTGAPMYFYLCSRAYLIHYTEIDNPLQKRFAEEI
jgi:hypothetical protein